MSLEFLFLLLLLLVLVHSRVDLFPLHLVHLHPSPLSILILALTLFQHLKMSKLAALDRYLLKQLQLEMQRTQLKLLLSLHMKQLFSIFSRFQQTAHAQQLPGPSLTNFFVILLSPMLLMRCAKSSSGLKNHLLRGRSLSFLLGKASGAMFGVQSSAGSCSIFQRWSNGYNMMQIVRLQRSFGE